MERDRLVGRQIEMALLAEIRTSPLLADYATSDAPGGIVDRSGLGDDTCAAAALPEVHAPDVALIDEPCMCSWGAL